MAARIDELEGGGSVNESSLAELSPFSLKSRGSEKRLGGQRLTFTNQNGEEGLLAHTSHMTQTV